MANKTDGNNQSASMIKIGASTDFADQLEQEGRKLIHAAAVLRGVEGSETRSSTPAKRGRPAKGKRGRPAGSKNKVSAPAAAE
jgi:hypothetical protein